MQIRDILMPELVRLDIGTLREEEQELVTSRLLEYLRTERPGEICQHPMRSILKNFAENGIRSQILQGPPSSGISPRKHSRPNPASMQMASPLGEKVMWVATRTGLRPRTISSGRRFTYSGLASGCGASFHNSVRLKNQTSPVSGFTAGEASRNWVSGKKCIRSDSKSSSPRQ